MHPVLESLRNTDKQWLIETLYAFNSGNVVKFQALKSAWGQQVSKITLSLKKSALVCSLLQYNSVFMFCKSHTERIFALQPDLAAHEVKLMQKIQLLCVMEVICP